MLGEGAAARTVSLARRPGPRTCGTAARIHRVGQVRDLPRQDGRKPAGIGRRGVASYNVGRRFQRLRDDSQAALSQDATAAKLKMAAPMISA